MKSKVFLILVFALMFFFFLQVVSAATVTINPGDNIQNAINNVNPGDTIIMNSGRYPQYNLQIDKELTLTGATNNPDDVVIDAEENGRVIEVLGGADNVKLQGFTLTNGYYDGTWNGDGAGVSNFGGTTAQPTLMENCKLTNNHATGEGGAIYNNGNLVITNCLLINNTSDGNGGGISNRETLVLTGGVIQENYASSMGGGIYNLDTMTIKGTKIQENKATAGGGILNDGEMTITASTIKQNQAIMGGGIDNFQDLTITNCNIQDNTGPMGGGICNWALLDILRSTIQENNADNMGGGILNIRGFDKASLTITDSRILKNHAEKGGGIYNCDILTVTGSTIHQNTATNGGGIFNGYIENVYGTVVANFNRIVGNTANTIENQGNTVNAEYNWWGSNKPNFADLITGEVDYISWLVMTYTAHPLSIMQGGISILTADFRYDYLGVFHNSALGHLPDGTLVTFKTSRGDLGSKIVVVGTINGVATTILRGEEAAGDAVTSANLDLQTLKRTVTITPNPAGAASSTIGMLPTGMPLIGLIGALMLLTMGLVCSNRRSIEYFT